MTHDTSATDDNRTVSGGSIDRRRFIALSGAGAAASALAGCLPEPEEEGDGSTPEGTATEMQTPDGPPEGSLTVGVMAPLSGAAQFVGTGASRAARIARDEINEDGGIMDREIEYVEADTAGDPSTAQGEVERLVNEDGVDVIIGTYVSEVTQAILDYTAQFGVPFIVTGSAAPSTVTDFIGQDYERYKNFFRVGPLNSTYQAEAFSTYADFLSDRYDWNTFGFVADRAAWTTPYSDLLPDSLREKGYNVEYEDRISIETDNFTPVLDEVADSGVQGLFRFFAHINAIPMMAEWHERQLGFSFEGIHVASQLPEYWQLSNGAGRFETTSQTAAGGVTDVTEETVPFTETYQERFADEGPPGAHPMYMGFNTYDALHFYKGAVEAAGTWDYETFLDNIVDGMLSQEMVGAGAEISLFGPDGEYPHDVKPDRDDDGAITNVPITQWQQEGALECVYPSTFNTAEHAIPPWMQ